MNHPIELAVVAAVARLRIAITEVRCAMKRAIAAHVVGPATEAADKPRRRTVAKRERPARTPPDPNRRRESADTNQNRDRDGAATPQSSAVPTAPPPSPHCLNVTHLMHNGKIVRCALCPR